MVLDGDRWSATEAWRRICHDLDDILRYIDPNLLDVSGAVLSYRWRPPPKDHVKLNVNRRYRDDNSPCMGFRCVLGDEASSWMLGMIRQELGG